MLSTIQEIVTISHSFMTQMIRSRDTTKRILSTLVSCRRIVISLCTVSERVCVYMIKILMGGSLYFIRSEILKSVFRI
jgi:hypothetical protein